MAQVLVMESPSMRSLFHHPSHVDDDNAFPQELARIRDDTTSPTSPEAPSLVAFATESLHSFNFCPPDHRRIAKRKEAWDRLTFAVGLGSAINIMAGHEEHSEDTEQHPHGLDIKTRDPSLPEMLPPASDTTGANSLPTSTSPITAPTSVTISTTLPRLPTGPSSANLHSLHSPFRFHPPTHATITTSPDLTVLTINETACMMLRTSHEELIGRSITDVLGPEYREKVVNIVRKKGEEGDGGGKRNKSGKVLVCGRVVRVLRKDRTTHPASLWLKEKVGGDGEVVLIWVLEEIKEFTVTLLVTPEGRIVDASLTFSELYGYTRSEMSALTLVDIIPSLATNLLTSTSTPHADLKKIPLQKFFGTRTKCGTTFPVIAKLHTHYPSGTLPAHIAATLSHYDPTLAHDDECSVELISMEHISGVITVLGDGKVQGCNEVFGKYLFGVDGGTGEMGVMKIESLIPGFWGMVEKAKVNGTAMQPGGLERRASVQSLSGGQIALTANLVAVHRDGTPLNVDVSVRTVGDVYAVWVSFEREMRVGIPMRIEEGDADEDEEEEVMSAKPMAPPRDVDFGNEGGRGGAAGGEEEGVFISESSKASIPDTEPHIASASHDITSQHCTSTFTTLSLHTHASPSPSIEYPRNIDAYTISSPLGEGAYGYVRLAHPTSDPDEKVVIKFIVKARVLADCWTRLTLPTTPSNPTPTTSTRVPLESHILTHLLSHPHPSIPTLLTSFEDSHFFYLVMRAHGSGSGMDLFDAIELAPQGLGPQRVRKIFKQVVEAVRHLHSVGVVHRDIKDENVILDIDKDAPDGEDGVRAQLVDFGSAAYLYPPSSSSTPSQDQKPKKFSTFCGTLDYASPEVLLGHKYEGKPQDIWALGVLLYTMWFRENPFYNIDEIVEGVVRVRRKDGEGGAMGDGEEEERVLELVRWMMEKDVEKRPGIEEVGGHEW